MNNKWLEKLIGLAVRQDSKELNLPPPDPPNVVAQILNVWLEQAASLKQLRMHDHAYRLLNSARSLTLSSMKADPLDPMAWVNIGRVLLASEDYGEAKKVLDHAIELAQQSGNTDVEGFAGSALFQVLRQQSDGDDEIVDLKKTLTQAQYRVFQRQQLEQMFYVCQSCGHLNLMMGEHCAHCHFAPKDLNDIKLSGTLCTVHFKVPTLLGIALEIQRDKNPHDFIHDLDVLLNRIESDQGVLEKIRQNAEDDYLDFNALDHCPSCHGMVWRSDAVECPKCHTKLNRPMLQKLAICVDRILQQFIWTARRSDSKEFGKFITLMVNIKYMLVRVQRGPTEAQRHTAAELLIKLSPLYTQNGGGVVWVRSADKVVSEVLNPDVHKDIGPTIDFFRDELKHFLCLTSDAVSLF